MPGTGRNIYMRKDGRWEGRYIKTYSDDGKSRYGYVYAKTCSEVKMKLYESNIKNCGQYKYENITFEELTKKWLHCSKNRFRASTLPTYINII